jgi:hypothetical protein
MCVYAGEREEEQTRGDERQVEQKRFGSPIQGPGLSNRLDTLKLVSSPHTSIARLYGYRHVLKSLNLLLERGNMRLSLFLVAALLFLLPSR